MTKGGKSSGDYEGWLLRLIDKAEDLGLAMYQDEWQKFCEDKVIAAQEGAGFEDVGITRGQRSAFEELRQRALEFQKDVGIKAERHERLAGTVKHRYRDLTGEFGRKGTWVAARKVESRIMAEVTYREKTIKREIRYKGV